MLGFSAVMCCFFYRKADFYLHNSFFVLKFVPNIERMSGRDYDLRGFL